MNLPSLPGISLFLLRIALGWLHFYAGITKVLDPSWSAAGYLQNANTLPGLYAWMAQPDILPFINFVNEWGLTLLGLSLIFGLFVRLSAPLGMLLMVLYYVPILSFPYVGEHSFLVDDHIIHIAALFVLAAFGAGRIWGLGGWCARRGGALCGKFD